MSAPGDRDPSADDLRITTHAGIERGPRLEYTFEGIRHEAFLGETVAAALLASGQRVLRTTGPHDEVRGVFCGMGVCYDCLVVIDGRPSQRACMIEVREGMDVRRQSGPGPG